MLPFYTAILKVVKITAGNSNDRKISSKNYCNLEIQLTVSLSPPPLLTLHALVFPSYSTCLNNIRIFMSSSWVHSLVNRCIQSNNSTYGFSYYMDYTKKTWRSFKYIWKITNTHTLNSRKCDSSLIKFLYSKFTK